MTNDPQLLVHVEAVRQEQAAWVTQRLQKRKRGRLIELVDEAAGLAEGETMHLSDYEPACAAGCVWCCYQRVTATPAEVLRIVEYLRETLPAPELARLRAEISDAHIKTRGLSPAGRLATRQLCPLLVDGQCSVYYVRPLPCRGYTSNSVEACQQRVENPDRPVSVQGDPVRYLLCLGVLNGLSEGLAAAGMEGGTVELIAALHLALETPNALTRWLKGERIFERAQVEVEPLVL